MKNKKKWYLKPSDPEMCEWAYSYLGSRFHLPQNIPKGSECLHCNNLLDSLHLEDTRKLLVTEIQNAWRQEKHRRKQKIEGKSTRSYSLSDDSLKQLTELAADSKLTLAKTLEKLINQAYNREQTKKRRKLQPAPHLTSAYHSPFSDGVPLTIK